MQAIVPSTKFLFKLQDKAFRFGLALLGLLIVAWFVYRPGITGPFVLDDYSNLSPIGENGGINSWQNFLRFVFGGDAGPTGRPVSMLAFLIDAQACPPNIAALKYTNILIHLLSATSLCWLSYCIMQALRVNERRAAWLALLVTALWVLHPLNSTTALYVVQRMTQLMTLFSLLALICYVKGRLLLDRDHVRGSILLGLALFPCGLLALLSKENGVLFLLIIIIMEHSIFRTSARSGLFKLWYRAGVLLPMAIIVVYLAVTAPSSLEGYAYRHFDLVERLLTESRILCSYIARIIFPTTLGAGLYHDDIIVSTGLLQPLTTLFSLLFLAALLLLAVVYRKTQPMVFFGITWFFAMQILESSYLPLELYFEHRNSMAMIGPLLAIVWYLNVFLEGEFLDGVKKAVKMGVGAMLLFMTALIWQNSVLWGNAGDLHAYWAYEKPESSRAQIVYADFLVVNGNPEAALERLQQAQALHPNEITIMLHTWNTACTNNLVPPVSLAEIAARDGLEFKHNDINFHLKALIENYFSGACEVPPVAVLLQLFESVGDIAMSPNRRAGYHFLYSDLYVYLRQLNQALVQLSNAYRLHPVPDIPIRQAILSASAGNYSDSLVFLGRAREANELQSPLLPSFEPQIAAMEADLQRMLESQQ